MRIKEGSYIRESSHYKATVACPYCKAKVNEACKVTYESVESTHVSRIKKGWAEKK